MSRFLYPTPTPAPRPVATLPRRPVVEPTIVAPRTTPAVKAPTFAFEPAPPVSMAQKAGLIALSIYLVGAYANDISMRLLHIKPYLTITAGVAVLIAFVFCGASTLPVLRHPISKVWLFLMFWMTLAAISSRWPGGSFTLLENYFPKSHLVLFYMGAFALNLEQCRKLFLVKVLVAAIVLISCVAFGTSSGGRFMIPDSLWFENPNELALVLLLSLGFFLFLIEESGLIGKALGVMGLIATAYYLLKTGSRGSAIALLVVLLGMFIVSRHRMKMLMFSVPAIFVLLLVTPSNTLHRLTLIVSDPANEIAASIQELGDRGDESSLDSQFQRQQLLRQSLRYTIQHPLLGIGPGEFSDAYQHDSQKRGVHVADLGTHNTYTQLSSETGLPGGIAFIVLVLLAVKTNFRLYRLTRNRPELKTVANMALCLFACTLGYAVNVMFHHLAYTGYMAELGGLTVAVWLAGNRAMEATPARAT